ncbi:MAG: hypothetical protein M3Z66_01255, partial [Chloroflexota bacterium]|nr:hypothetical protein [Chloroflexota bacterium]
IYTVGDLEHMGIHPLAYRAFTFQAHYRTPLTFSLDALQATQTALVRIWEQVAELVQTAEPEEMEPETEAYRFRFHEAINHDLDLPGAMVVLHELLGTKLTAGQKLGAVADFDRVLGLSLIERGEMLSRISPEEEALLAERATARQSKEWARSDELRAELAAHGLEVRDSAGGQRWVRREVLQRPKEPLTP